MIDPLQQAQQALHAPTPLIQHIVRISGLRKTDDPRGAVDLRVHRLRRHQLADVLLRLFFAEVEEFGQPAHLDAGVVFRDDAHVVLDDALAQVFPAGVGFGIGGGVRCGVEDVGGAEVRAVFGGYGWPWH